MVYRLHLRHDDRHKIANLSHLTGLQCRTGEVFAALGVQSRFDDETHECAGKLAHIVLQPPNTSNSAFTVSQRLSCGIPTRTASLQRQVV